MRFCPECGAELLSQAKFCVGCGHRIASTRRRIPWLAVGVFAGILAAGTAISALVVERYRVQTPVAEASRDGGSELPKGHPRIKLPPEAVKLVSDLEAAAGKDPNNIKTWNRLGQVSARAAIFDDSYYAKALSAYGHTLKIDHDNLDALRGTGNVYFDQHNFDQAIAAYEHYLSENPKDPNVMSDLGTMYFSTGNSQQAIDEYNKAILLKPDFFEGYYNLGIVYQARHDNPRARSAFEKALQLAPDDRARDSSKTMLAKVGGGSSAARMSRPSATVAGNPATFEDAIEQTLRSLPFAGPKVKTVQWPSKLKAVVLMDSFPMNQMPPFARHKFLNDLKRGIADAKTVHKVNDTVVVQIADAATGHVMETLSE